MSEALSTAGTNSGPRLAASVGRLGTESAFAVLARAKALEASGADVINLGIGQPDFPTPGHIVEAACQALRDGHHGYTPANGILPLREAVSADLHRRHGVTISPDRVLIMPGGKVTMFFAVTMIGEPGAEIIYPDPGFPIYESVVRYSGATPVPLRLEESEGFALSAERLESLITPATRLVIINSPANPTGGVIPAAEVDRIVEVLRRHPHVAIMSDEIYSQMLYDGEVHSSLLRYPDLADRLILLDGWSKTYAMTGWRLGMSVWPEAWVGHAERLAINCHSCVNASAQFAAKAALEGPQDEVLNMVAAFDRRRTRVVELLNGLSGVSCITPRGAFYAFPNISGLSTPADTLQNRFLEEAHVATIAGTSFGAAGEGYLRISYANSLENIERAIERMAELIEKF